MTIPLSIDLPYGRGHLTVPLVGDNPTVVAPRDAPPLRDPARAVRSRLRRPVAGPPLAELARGRRRVVLSVCDGTRPQPREVVLPVILDEIASVAPAADLTVLVATGTHRGNTEPELLAMLGREVLDRVRVVNHDARDEAALVDLGTVGEGVPLRLSREWVEADLRITTGFVEPHFFAGFSGGPKMVAPGLAGLGTIMVLHDARRIGDPRATWGPVVDNPVHRDIRACAAACPPHFAVDVLLDRSKRITHVYAGELFGMHAAACGTAYRVAMRAVEAPFDVVVTTNSGYPLDQNLYQAVKGMAAAERVVRPGGTIVVAAECADGLPEHGSFARVLRSADSPRALAELICSPGFAVDDQWQVQVLARILTKATVALHCDGLTASQVTAAHLQPVGDVAAAVEDALRAAGPAARLCYLPEGPQTIPYLRPGRGTGPPATNATRRPPARPASRHQRPPAAGRPSPAVAHPPQAAVHAAPTVAEVARKVAVFAELVPVDLSWCRFTEATRPAVDLGRGGHRRALHAWLNAWGCRIRYPRPGEPDVFDDALGRWWPDWRDRLPAGSLARLTDEEIGTLGDCYAALEAMPVAAAPAARTLGPTAAAKALYALRPEAVMPWDAAIATRLHGRRDGAAFARHLRLGRDWAHALLAESGTDEAALPGLLGRPGMSCAKILDEYCYVAFSRRERPPG